VICGFKNKLGMLGLEVLINGENTDKLLKIRQIHQYFPHQDFVPSYATISIVL